MSSFNIHNTYDAIAINKPWIEEEEKREVLSVLDEEALTSPAKEGGKRVRDLESLLEDYLKVKHVVAVNSGTAALHAALLSAGIQHGDEVLLPSFTFVATANSVIATGAKPVFVDVKKEDYTIDVQSIKSKISEKTKCIIPVHLYGHPSDMDEISEVARQHSIKVIEDACQSLGSVYKHKQTGTVGCLGCFSFYASKVLTSGEGGAIATEDDILADKLKMIRNHGMVEGYDTRVFGLNLRLPELSAAIAKIQVKKLEKMLYLRRKNADMLTKTILPLADRYKIKLPQERDEKNFNWYLYTIAFESDNERDKIKAKMLSDKIGVTVYYKPPVHRTPYYEKMFSKEGAALSNTDWASDHVLSLPVHPLVTEREIDWMGESLKNALDSF